MRLATLLPAALSLLATVVAESVVDLTPANFDDIVLKSGKPALVEFFAPWCGHCKTLAPIYEELAGAFSFASDKVIVAKVDADAHKTLGRKYGVQGFPTLKWFDGKSDKPTEYNAGRDLESLSGWITEKTGIRPRVKKAKASSVVMLNDQSFKEKIGSEQSVLVAFTAPWCGHCKSLAPVWESLAEDFVAEDSVIIAKVDAEAPNAKATAQDQGVTSYPTIKFFPKGSSSPVAYSGGRSEEDLVTYVNSQIGSHRTVGGGLDAVGGTISALDTVVEQIIKSADYASGLVQLKTAAQGLKEKYAAYYVKVVEKREKNKGYVAKELARLENLLKKGGLVPEKKDDLTARSNILRKFLPFQNEKSEL